MKFIEAINDPTSHELSMSRIAMGVIILVFYPVGIVLKAKGVDILSALNTALGTAALVYGANSAMGAWNRLAKGPRDGGENQ